MEGKDFETLDKVSNEALTSDCDSCGGDMSYDPELRQLKCNFCGSTQEIDFTSNQVEEIALEEMHAYENESNWQMEAKVIECKNCGGQTVANAEDETAYCAFCGSQHMVVHTDGDTGLRPQGILPYEVSFKAAKARMDTWVKQRWLAPTDLKERFRGKHLKGVYMPYWTFDAHVYSTYQCRVGQFYYVGSGNQRNRKTKWRAHSGTYHKFYDDQLILGIDSDEAGLMKNIEPFRTDSDKVLDYKPDYLAGYLAKKHTIKPNAAWMLSKESMANEIGDEIKGNMPEDTFDSYRQTVSYKDVTFKHILLPVYMTAYEYNNTVYNVMINGQTGEVQGKAPVSPIKVAGLVFLGIMIAVIVLIISNG